VPEMTSKEKLRSYLLLSTNSGLRWVLDGKKAHNVPGVAGDTLTPASSDTEFYTVLQDQLENTARIAPGNLNRDNLMTLRNGGTVTKDRERIMTALDMVYDPNQACPDGNDQDFIVASLA
jgi:hypothetical protein